MAHGTQILANDIHVRAPQPSVAERDAFQGRSLLDHPLSELVDNTQSFIDEARRDMNGWIGLLLGAGPVAQDLRSLIEFAQELSQYLKSTQNLS